jgi:hypothetical protein
MSSTTGFRRSFTLTGATVNAMALIAPGAFLWITYQVARAVLCASSRWRP